MPKATIDIAAELRKRFKESKDVEEDEAPPVDGKLDDEVEEVDVDSRLVEYANILTLIQKRIYDLEHGTKAFLTPDQFRWIKIVVGQWLRIRSRAKRSNSTEHEAWMVLHDWLETVKEEGDGR